MLNYPLSKGLKSLTYIALITASGVSSASCWGPGDKTEEIFRQEFKLKSNNGPVKAVASYQVYSRGEVCESGSINIVDSRECTAHPYSRRFIRTLTVYPTSGAPVEMGRTEKLVATARQLTKKGPCTDHARTLTNEFFSTQTSNANAWKSEIDQDLDEVRRTLKLIGEIGDASVTFQR